MENEKHEKIGWKAELQDNDYTAITTKDIRSATASDKKRAIHEAALYDGGPVIYSQNLIPHARSNATHLVIV